MDRYAKEKDGRLGEGAHGVVTKYRVRSREQIAAVRRAARLQQEGELQASVAEAAGIAAAPASAASTQSTPRKRKHLQEAEEAAAMIAAVDDADVDDIELPAPAGTAVAIKKIRLPPVKDSLKNGVSTEALREIKLLQELRHPHVLPLLDTFSHDSSIHLVLECMSGDMEQLLRALSSQKRGLEPADVKAYMRMILQGMEHCHANFIMHRDIKPGNLLIGEDGGIKIADFGLAKVYGSPDRKMSPGACTIWYRAPELLFGATAYGSAADMWSVGCVMGELFTMRPLFAGPESELSQLQRIFDRLGTPTEADWTAATHLQLYVQFKARPAQSRRAWFSALTDDAIDLLQGLLTLNPQTRLTATEALNHRYFTSKPLPTPLKDLPKLKDLQAAAVEAKEMAAKPSHAGKPSGKILNFDNLQCAAAGD